MPKELQLDIVVAVIIGMISGIAGYFVTKYLREPFAANLKETLS